MRRCFLLIQELHLLLIGCEAILVGVANSVDVLCFSVCFAQRS